jgi:hypothetical protein
LRHLAGDAKGGVIALFNVLADDSGEQGGGLSDLGAKLFSFEGEQAGVAVFGPRIDQCLTGCSVVPSTCGLAELA